MIIDQGKHNGILLVNDTLWGGGRERRIVQLIAGLNRAGVSNITLVILDERISYPEIYKYNVKLVVISRRGRFDISVFRKLYDICKNDRPAIVNPWSYQATFYAVPISLLLRINCIGSFIVDSVRPKFFSANWFGMNAGFLWCRKIVGNSMAGHRACGTPLSKRVLIYNGFDESRLDSVVRTERLGGEVRIAMIGRLDRQKDFKTFIDAVAKLKVAGVTFEAYIVGQGVDESEIRRYAHERGDTGIVFAGFVQEIDTFIASVDIGVLCTDPKFHSEGVSNAILEMMAQGKPVIATNGGGTPEIVEHGVNGFLVPPYDSDELAARIHELIYNGSLRDSLGANAGKTVKEKFTLSNMTSEFLDLFNNYI